MVLDNKGWSIWGALELTQRVPFLAPHCKIETAANVGADGVVIWGSSGDVSSAAKCDQLRVSAEDKARLYRLYC